MRGSALSRRQEQAIVALLSAPTVAAAAQLAHVGEASLFRWMASPGFRAALMAARRSAVSVAVSRLQQASGEAVSVLTGIMLDEGVQPSARVIAAKAVLAMALHAVEIEDLAARIEALEQTQGGAQE